MTTLTDTELDELIEQFEQAKREGVLTDKTIEHFEHLINYIK